MQLPHFKSKSVKIVDQAGDLIYCINWNLNVYYKKHQIDYKFLMSLKRCLSAEPSRNFFFYYRTLTVHRRSESEKQKWEWLKCVSVMSSRCCVVRCCCECAVRALRFGSVEDRLSEADRWICVSVILLLTSSIIIHLLLFNARSSQNRMMFFAEALRGACEQGRWMESPSRLCWKENISFTYTESPYKADNFMQFLFSTFCITMCAHDIIILKMIKTNCFLYFCLDLYYKS